MDRKLVVLTGAGISAESGLKTFRDSGGLWEGYDVTEVATPEAWKRNQKLVLDFYNERRRQLKSATPNEAHLTITKLQQHYSTIVITQNVDNLHERAGNENVLHLHGQLTKVRSTSNPSLIYDWEDDLNIGQHCDEGSQLRPHIVWFGESVPMLEVAIQEMVDAHVVIIVGTSMQVYPAASLIGYAPAGCEVYYVDPKPHISYELGFRPNLHVIEEKATTGMQRVSDLLLKQ